jgi:sarcosine oxidase gamma subunit
VAEVWSVLANPDACDLAMRAPRAGRIAADEVMVAGPVAADIRAAIAKVDPDAVVRRADDGWAEVVVDGSDARDVIARLSELDVPATGFVHGDVARVAARIYAREDAVSIFVRSSFEATIRRRIAEVTAP